MGVPDIGRPDREHYRQVRVAHRNGYPTAVKLDGPATALTAWSAGGTRTSRDSVVAATLGVRALSDGHGGSARQYPASRVVRAEVARYSHPLPMALKGSPFGTALTQQQPARARVAPQSGRFGREIHCTGP
jgi:hypothetical protein